LRRKPYRSALIVVVMMFLAASAYGQVDQGRIGGVVKDSTGAVIPGVEVFVKNERTGEQHSAVTGDAGEYLVTALRPSTYSVKAGLPGFAPAETTGVQLVVGQQSTLDITLRPASVATDVQVVSAFGEVAVDTSSATIGVNVVPREVQSLPLNGRQVSQLYLQAPGSVNSGSGTFGDVHFAGRSTEQNIIRYDGVEGTATIDASPGNLNGEIASPFRLQSSLENIQEFRVESSNYTAEFGTGTGGQISLITKSGGNAFHGSLFEYLRNDALDAANFFDNIIGQKAPLRLNQFGGSIGGPIVRDKSFFFFSYENYRLRAGVNSTEAIPGDVSRICAPASNGVPCVEANGQPSRTLALLAGFKDPRAQIVSTGFGTNLFDVAQLQTNAILNERAVSLRIDHRLNSNNTLYVRYFRDDGNIDQPEGVTGRRVIFIDNPQNGVLGFQSALTPKLFNEFKFGFNGTYTRTNGQAPIINGVDLSKLAINISGNTANFSIAGQGTSAGTANPGGLVRANSATNGRGQPYTVYSLNFLDNMSWSRGKHNFKFGEEVRLNRFYTDRLGGTTYVFNNLPDFLANRPASTQYLGDVSDPSPFNNGATGNRLGKVEYYIGYAQDEWKLHRNVTLNYGLRYEYYTPVREANHLDVIFNPTTGVLDPSDRAFTKNNKAAFAPRIGLTWGPGKTVLRGGFGIFYGPGQLEDQLQPIESDRVSSTLTSGPLLEFNPNQDAFINAVRSSFAANPTNRNYQPRAYQIDYKIPEKIYSYTFSIQRELPYNVVATAAYVGSQGRNLFLRGLSNIFRPGATTIVDGTPIPADAGIVNRTNAAGQVIGVTTVRQFSIISGTSVLNPFAEIDTKSSGGTDSYNSTQLTLTRRMSNGVTLNSQYTLAKSFGITSGSNESRTAAEPTGARPRPVSGDTNNYAADRGYNTFDIRHNFNFSAVYDLPFGAGRKHSLSGLANAVLGNWQIGGISNIRSGVPVDVTVVRPDVVAQCVVSSCIVNTSATATTVVSQGFTTALPSVSAAQPLPPGFAAVVNAPGGGSSRQTRRPDLIAGVDPYLGRDRNFLNPAAFAIPVPGKYGNLPRNALKGPDFQQFDLILAKRFPVRESLNLEFRSEFFNIFNRANFANPGSTLNSALPSLTFNTAANAFVLGSGTQPGQPFTQSAAGTTFGLLRQTVERTVGLGTNRQIQFALRLNF
jgi:hypothetical protein